MHTRNFAVVFLLLLISLFFITPISQSASTQSGYTILSSKARVIYGGYDGLVLMSDFESVTSTQPPPQSNPIHFNDINGNPVTNYWVYNGLADIWIEGLDAIKLPAGYAPHSGTRCLGLETSSSTAYRSQLDVYIKRIKDAAGNPLIDDEWYYSGWFFLPSNWSLASSGWRWGTLGNPYQNMPTFYPQVEIHVIQPDHAQPVYGIQVSIRSSSGYIDDWVDYRPFPLPLGKWFKVEWHVKTDSSTTIDAAGNLVPNGDSLLQVWIDGKQICDEHGSDFPTPLPKSGLVGYLTDTRPTENYITIGKIYYGDADPIPKQLWVDDVELWNSIPP